MLLEVKNLSIKYKNLEVIKDLSFKAEKGECLALLGHNGSGKTSIALAILNLLNTPYSGSIIFDGKLINNEKTARELREKDIRIILQEVELNPSVKVGKQILDSHKGLTKQDVYKLLEKVQLEKDVYNKMSHELSGGMRQRVNIAIAIAPKPKLIIADEACSNLDKQNEENIMALLKEIKKETSLLFISHSIEEIKTIADKVLVLKEGKQVEFGPVSLLENPKNEYTKKLVEYREAVKDKNKLSLLLKDLYDTEC